MAVELVPMGPFEGEEEKSSCMEVDSDGTCGDLRKQKEHRYYDDYQGSLFAKLRIHLIPSHKMARGMDRRAKTVCVVSRAANQLYEKAANKLV